MSRFALTTSTLGLALLAAFARADLGDQMLKLAPLDGAADAAFGCAVDVSGNVVVVGSQAAGDSGAAYLFDAHTGVQLHKLLSDDGAAGDAFGTAVALGGGVVVVGATGDDDYGEGSGAAYLFDAVTGAQLRKLVPGDGAAGDAFGASVATADSIVAVGAMYDDDHGADSGAVYLFDAAGGNQLAKLHPDDAAGGDGFGGAVALSGGRLAVGAHAKWNGALFLAGAAYVFDVTKGSQLHKLLPADAAVNDFFGAAIDIDGDVVVVGAWGKSIVFDHSGAAYAFDAATGAQLHRMVPADTADRDNFGRAVTIEGDLVAVAAPGDSDSGVFEAGSAYLYAATDGTEILEVHADDAAPLDNFGSGIAIADGVLVVGADRDDDLGSSSGSAYVFDAGAGACPADIVGGDGVVGVADLLALLAAWGTDGPGADLGAPFDIVGVEDLLYMLGAWGSCDEG